MSTPKDDIKSGINDAASAAKNAVNKVDNAADKASDHGKSTLETFKDGAASLADKAKHKA